MKGPLGGRVAVVTGANHGIGAATAAALAALGADVLIGYLRVPGAGEEPEAYDLARALDGSATVEACVARGRRAVAVEADLTDPAAAELLFDRAEAELGPVDVLVNNASGWRADSFTPGRDVVNRAKHRLTAQSADATLLVDARASALLIGEFARRLLDRGGTWGRIVGLASGGTLGFPGEVSYGAAKAALVSYTMSAALELADHGVTANVVYPPVTDTGWVTPEVEAFVASSREHTHVATAEEVAGVVAWLCTDAARLVNANRIELR